MHYILHKDRKLFACSPTPIFGLYGFLMELTGALHEVIEQFKILYVVIFYCKLSFFYYKQVKNASQVKQLIYTISLVEYLSQKNAYWNLKISAMSSSQRQSHLK